MPGKWRELEDCNDAFLSDGATETSYLDFACTKSSLKILLMFTLSLAELST